jgi:predicted transcriptional regulator
MVDQWGCETEVARPIAPCRVQCSKFRDLMIVRLRAKNVSLVDIGGILGISRQAVHKRIKNMPDEIQEYYRRASLG